jgi:hypothetical protein
VCILYQELFSGSLVDLMIGILLCALFFGLVCGISYYFAYSDIERRRPPPRVRPVAPGRAPPAAAAAAREEEENNLFEDD